LRDNPSVRVVNPKSPEAVAEAIAVITSSQHYYEGLVSTAFESVQDYTWDKLYSSAMRSLFLQVSNPHRAASVGTR
jgi:hypothetical protein